MLRLPCSSANYKLWSTFILSLNVSDFFKTELNSEVKKTYSQGRFIIIHICKVRILFSLERKRLKKTQEKRKD